MWFGCALTVMLASRPMPLSVSALMLSKPLHFGDYGGIPLKLIWAMLDLICIVVLVSGIYLWLKKRHTPLEVRLGLAAAGKGVGAA